MDRRAKPKKGKAEAKRPRIRKPLKDDSAKVRDLETRLAEASKLDAEDLEQLQTRDRELAEAREQLTVALGQVRESHAQQAATSEILRVISSSSTDVQPVFDSIAQNALRLCEAQFASVFRFDGQLVHFVAHHGGSPEGIEALRRAFPIVPHTGSAGGRAILTGAVAHIPDVHKDPSYTLDAVGNILRSTVAVPMMREEVPIGTINVNRSQPVPFSDSEIELLKTFADQAVIAIVNVRLFNETKEALKQQTATSEILRVIASSPKDVRPVFETIVASALRLCRGGRVALFT